MKPGRETIEHLAEDTGLAPEEIAGDDPLARGRPLAEHLADDAGIAPDDLQPERDPMSIAKTMPPD